MTVSQTTRFQLYRWSSAADPFTRDHMTTSHDNLEAEAAGFTQAGSRPAASAEFEGFFHYDSTTSSAGTLSYCNGVEWFDVGKFGEVVALDGSLSNGVSNNVARADHTHSLASGSVSNSSIATSAVTSGKLAAGAVTEAKIANLAVTSGKIADLAVTTGKLNDLAVTTGKIADGNVTNTKLAASGLDAGKFTTGTLPIARIADNAVSFAKVQDVAGYSVVGKSTADSGDAAAIVASADTVLRRDGSGNLEFGKITPDHLGENINLVTDTDGNYVATVAAGGGMSVSGSGSSNAAVTVSHADTSSQGNVSTSSLSVLSGANVDTYGHVTSLTSRDLTTNIRGLVGGMIKGNTQISAAYNGTDVNLSLIADPTITLTGDVTGLGTMTNLGSVIIDATVVSTAHNHDDRYFREDEIVARQADVYGGTTAHGGRRIYISNSGPSGGNDDDIWLEF